MTADEVIVGARALQPEAILLVMPWHDTDRIERCADTLLKLPAEVHLGPEHILDRFDEVALVKIGPISSLQLRRMPQPYRLGDGMLLGGFFSTGHQHGPGCYYTTVAHLPSYHDYSTGFRCCADASETPRDADRR